MKKKKRVLFSIGFKLVLIISFLVIVSLGSLTYMVSTVVGQSISTNTEDANLTLANQGAASVKNELTSIRSNVFLMLDMLNATGGSGILTRQTSSYFFERNPSIAAVVIPNDKELINERFFLSNEIETSYVQEFIDLNQDKISKTENGESFAMNAASVFDLPILVFMFPWQESGMNQAVMIFFTSDALSNALGSSKTNLSCLVNFEGDVLVHPDFDLVKAGVNLSSSPLLDFMKATEQESGQTLYTDTDEVEYFGAYERIPIADVAVLTTIQKELALEDLNKQTKTNIYVTLAVLFIAVLFIFLYSKTISRPLRKLTAVANEIQKGNFNTELFDTLKTHRSDEIAVLYESTKDERQILNTVAMLTNKHVVKMLIENGINKEYYIAEPYKIKDKLANEHGIKVIRINCYYNHMSDRFSFIKENVIKELGGIFNLSNIDWILLEKNNLKSKIIEVCELWNKGLSIFEIMDIVHLCNDTVRQYLIQCSRIGLCDYTSGKSKQRTFNYHTNLQMEASA